MTQPPESGPADPQEPVTPAGPPVPPAPAPPVPPPGYGYPPPQSPQYPNPGYYAQPGWGPPYAAPYGPPPNNEKAVWALVLGIVGLVLFFCFAGIASIVAIFLGQQAKQEIDGSHGTQGGRGMAEAGFVMGIIGTVVLAVWVLLVVVGALADSGPSLV